MSYINIQAHLSSCPSGASIPQNNSNLKNLSNSQYMSMTAALEMDSPENRITPPSEFNSNKYAQYLAKKKGNSLRQFINKPNCNC
jgi:hypothetical protein